MNVEVSHLSGGIVLSRSINKTLRNYLITGALILIPLAVTGYIIVNGFLFLDRFLGGVLAKIVGRPIPGAGAVLTIALAIGVGMIATNVMGRRLISFGEKLLAKIPIVSVVYSAVKQLLEAFTIQSRSDGFKRVVLVEFPRRQLWSVGFVTNQEDWLSEKRLGSDMITVFVPTAPNPTTGFMFVLPKKDVVFLDLSVEAAFKVIISGGIVMPEGNHQNNDR